MTRAPRTRSRTLIVDGVPVRLCGGADGTPEGDAALAEVIRAVQAAAALLPALCHATPPEPGFRLPCLELAGHDLPHRNGSGHTWTEEASTN